VTSDSPLWRDRIRDEWLPRLGPRAAVLNASRRDVSERSAATALASAFGAGDSRPGAKVTSRDWCPLLIVVAPDGLATAYRLHRAFGDLRDGDGESLAILEARAFSRVGVEPPPPAKVTPASASASPGTG
jgi:hypothetical protein